MVLATEHPITAKAVALLHNYSLEMTAKDVDALPKVSDRAPSSTPISVTYLPGETFEARVKAATLIRKLGFVPIPHLSARRLSSVGELDRFLVSLSQEADLDRVLVVAGDCAPLGPFKDALDLIRTGRLAEHGVRRVGISGYPEGHPDIPSDLLWSAMSDKHRTLIEMGLEPIITTQFTFDAKPVIDWVAAVRDRGITSTIRLGIPGPASVKTLLRFAARCGVGTSTKVMRKYGVSITRLMSVAGPDRLVEELADRIDPHHHGDVRLHLYPFGGLERTTEWAAHAAGAAS